MGQISKFTSGKVVVVRQNLPTRLFTGSEFLHGKQQNYKSIDIYSSLFPQLELRFKEPFVIVGKSGEGIYRSVRIKFTNHKLQLLIVHAYIVKSVVKSAWHHFHISGVIDGVYYDVTEFFNREEIQLQRQVGSNLDYWTPVRRDLDGNLIINNPEMVKLERWIQLSTTNTVDMNLRKEPNTSSAIVIKIAPKSELICDGIVANGELVNGKNTWYHVTIVGEDNKVYDGWVSQAYCVEDGTPSLINKLKEINNISNL